MKLCSASSPPRLGAATCKLSFPSPERAGVTTLGRGNVLSNERAKEGTDDDAGIEFLKHACGPGKWIRPVLGARSAKPCTRGMRGKRASAATTGPRDPKVHASLLPLFDEHSCGRFLRFT